MEITNYPNHPPHNYNVPFLKNTEASCQALLHAGRFCISTSEKFFTKNLKKVLTTWGPVNII